MNIRHKRHALRKAMMRNVVPLKPPLDCVKLAARLREILLGNAGDAERAAFERELRGLKPGQKAMIAARAVNCERGRGYHRGEHNHVGTSEGSKRESITTRQAAEVVQVSISLAYDARVVLRRAAGAEIRTIEQGEAGSGVRMIADQLRQNLTPAQRKRIAAVPLAERGDAPARIQNQRLRAQVWRQLCAALQAADLPRLDDVVEIARSHDRAGLVDRKLMRAHERLGEFIDVWTRPPSKEED
jgi:hypothetical protein